MPPFPGILWGNPGQPFVPHGIQRGGGRRDPELGDVGGADRGRSADNRRDHTVVGSVFCADDGLVASPHP